MKTKQKRFYKNSSPMTARVIRDLYFIGKLKQHQIGRMFGLNQGNVSKVISGRIWEVQA